MAPKVHVGEFNSNIQAVDSQSLLNRQTMDRIVAEVVRRLKDMEQHDRLMQAERGLNNSVLDQRQS